MNVNYGPSPYIGEYEIVVNFQGPSFTYYLFSDDNEKTWKFWNKFGIAQKYDSFEDACDAVVVHYV